MQMTQAVEMVGDPAQPSTLVVDPDAVENPILEFFLNYWRAKRSSATLPTRASFAPQEVRGHLPWVVVVDAMENFADFRYRVVGSYVARYFLGDSTGKTAREAFATWGSEAVEDVVSLYARACVTRAPVRLTGPAIALEKLLLPDFDTIYLPYSSDGETPDRVVNVFTFNRSKVAGRRQNRSLIG
jgi:hypothetical protein